MGVLLGVNVTTPDKFAEDEGATTRRQEQGIYQGIYQYQPNRKCPTADPNRAQVLPGLDTDTAESTIKTLSSHLITLSLYDFTLPPMFLRNGPIHVRVEPYIRCHPYTRLGCVHAGLVGASSA
eukprot:6752242-Pyramimonas_sp.AAC.1